MVEECITPSGGKHKISDEFVQTDTEKIRQKWDNVKSISRDILIEHYNKTGIMPGKEIHNSTGV